MKRKANLTTYPEYTSLHSKKYQASIINPYLADKDEKDNIVKVHSDLYLLLRQQQLHKSIGLDNLRAYVDNMQRPAQASLPNLTDDELFTLIEPKQINNITDAYQYSRYLQSHHEEIKSKYKDLCDKRKSVADMFNDK